MNSRIFLQLCLFMEEKQTITFILSSFNWGVTEHFSPQKVFIFRRFFSYDSLAHCIFTRKSPGPEVIKLVSCSTQLSMKSILLINVKMPTIVSIVGILTFISRTNTTSESFKTRKSLLFIIIVFMSI